MRTLIYCESDFEARLIVGRLENEGIRAVVLNEYINNVLPMSGCSDTFAVQVAVNEEDFNRALILISEDEPPIQDSSI
jgi:hypothetical protein